MRALVVFPEGNGLHVIESLRRRFDPLAGVIAAHSTLVFPFASEISEVELRAHVEQALEGQAPFRVRFDGVSEVEEEYLFLDAVIGGERLVELNDRLYAGRLPSIGRRRTSTGRTSRWAGFETAWSERKR